MAKQIVDLGSVIANGADGDTAREAFTKVNSNFTEVYDNLQNQSGNLDTKVDKVVGKSLVDDAEIAKLLTVQANATQNNTDAYLLDRTNHTGSQEISTVSGLQTAIDSKANTLDLGTAAYTDSAEYATALQGSKADTAAQASDLGTAAYTASTDYATAAQGLKADTAAQAADLGTAAYEEADAFEKLLSPGAGIMIDRTNPAAPVISAGGAGAGDVTGPTSSVNDGVALFDGVSGKILKSGGVLGTAAFSDEIETITQVEAEAGVATDRRIWTSQRVRQAMVSWWNGVSTAFGRSVVSAATSLEGRAALGLGSASTREALGTSGALYSRDSIVGTVSQSAGQPTGAIIEAGSNVNGQYTRFADGTQICTYTGTPQNVNTASGNMFISSSPATWVFPIAFSDIPTVTGQVESASNRVMTFINGTAAMVEYRQMGASSSTAGVSSKIQAIGRWY